MPPGGTYDTSQHRVSVTRLAPDGGTKNAGGLLGIASFPENPLQHRARECPPP